MMIQHLKERAVTVNNVHINPPLHNQELFLVDHTKCYVVKMQIKLPLADVLSFENSWNLFFLKCHLISAAIHIFRRRLDH